MNILTFLNRKIPFPPSIKGFQSSNGVWKHLINFSHFRKHLLPSIDHFHFLNLKIPKKSSDFNILTLLYVDSASTHQCSNLKSDFEELSINFFDT